MLYADRQKQKEQNLELMNEPVMSSAACPPAAHCAIQSF
jgi:hypothetical protein